MKSILNELRDSDDQKAYARMKEIVRASESSSEYYPHFDEFASLLNDKKSYVRTRGFLLCSSQARWDDKGKLEQWLPSLLSLFHDPKPSVVRQCLSGAKEIVLFRPELSKTIDAELEQMDLSSYSDSMVPLLRSDIAELRKRIIEAQS